MSSPYAYGDPHNEIAYQQAKAGGYGTNPNYEAEQKAKIQADWDALDPRAQAIELTESSATHGMTPMAWNDVWLGQAKEGEQWLNDQTAQAAAEPAVGAAAVEPAIGAAIGGDVRGSLHTLAPEVLDKMWGPQGQPKL